MQTITWNSIVIAFAGLICLMAGYSVRDRNYGPLLIWGGVMVMLGVIVYYILRSVE